MTDREILQAIRNEATSEVERKRLTEVLWMQYKLLVHKNWATLRKQMNNSSAVLDVEGDYYSEAYIAFTKALAAINIDKIRDDNWKFLGYYRWYLKNVRTAFISKIRRTANNEVALTKNRRGSDKDAIMLPDVASSDVALDMEMLDPLAMVVRRESEERCERAVDVCLARWDATRQSIFKMRQEGQSKGDIAKVLQVHPATITYYLNSMRRDMEQELAGR